MQAPAAARRHTTRLPAGTLGFIELASKAMEFTAAIVRLAACQPVERTCGEAFRGSLWFPHCCWAMRLYMQDFGTVDQER